MNPLCNYYVKPGNILREACSHYIYTKRKNQNSLSYLLYHHTFTHIQPRIHYLHQRFRQMKLNPASKEFVPLSKDDGHNTLGESKLVLSEYRMFGQRCSECPKPSLPSKNHKPNPMSGSGTPFSGDHIGPPLLSDQGFRELNERGSFVSLLDYHRENIEPSRTCQYRLPSEIEFSEDNQRTEISRGESGGESGGTGDGVDPGPDGDSRYRKKRAYVASSSGHGQHGDSQYQLNPANGTNPSFDQGTNGRGRRTSEHSIWGPAGLDPQEGKKPW